MMKHRFLFGLFVAFTAPAMMFADKGPPLTDAEILKRFTYPPEFEAIVFASPTNIAYPIFLSASADGALFVGCDENGSLDQKPDRGRVVLCEDTQGTGKADKFTVFAKMDSPRGVAWDASTRTLYVMHPPFLTAYHDDGNTGASTRQEDLITGLGFDLNARGADHTINGIRLGIDGWIYIACGDYGAPMATGKDGRSFSLRGGGILRIRPDGSGLEKVVTGTRNILAVAISPTLDLFTRDNTNDGDDWNDRLSYNPLGAQMGYPSLFRNFSDEIIPAMIDYGGGSPVGAIFLDEPSLPSPWGQGFYSVEWGRGEIDMHPLTRDGAGWKAGTKKFMGMNRPTDLEVDGMGRLYVASWEGATFTYNGPNAGYIIRLAPKGYKAPAAPNFKSLSASQLVENIGSPSGVWRLAAQRELLKRGDESGVSDGLVKIVTQNANIGARVAAIFTLKQLLGVKSHTLLAPFLKSADLREYVLKAYADDISIAAQVPAQPFLAALNDANPRVRLQAVTGLGRLGKTEAAAALLPHTADADYTVAHIAVQALRWLNASEVCLNALDARVDSPDEPKVQHGALRVLQALYDPGVVSGLIARLDTINPALRMGIFQTLCRLDTREAAYKGIKQWWGTRPDTSGPIYQPERWSESDAIEAALKNRLTTASGEEGRQQVASLLRTKVTFPGLTDIVLAKAGNDSSARLDVVASLISPKTPTSAEIVTILTSIATAKSELPAARVRALRMLSGLIDKNFNAVVDAYSSLAVVEPYRTGAEIPEGPLAAVWEEFTRDLRHADHVGNFGKLARDTNSIHRVVGSTVLVNLATSPILKDGKRKQEATNAISRLWAQPESAATLLGVIGRMRAASFAGEVDGQLTNSDPNVLAAAKYAQAQLGADSATAASNASSQTIAAMSYNEVVSQAVAAPGDAKIGNQLFLKQGCVVCHTLSPKEPPKGPMLGGIAARYSRAELCESILKPSAKIAQGFESQSFTLKNGDQIDGFVVKEGGDTVEVRNLVGTSTVIEKGDIAERNKLTQSVMPEGLVANLTPAELGSLLAFLESTSSK
jgi:putative heme-binding domain-containing protein